MINYRAVIQDNFKIVNKKNKLVPFVFNSIQNHYYEHDMTNKDDVLKARQQGFSSMFTGFATVDFILQENSSSVIVADVEDNAEVLLEEKIKLFIRTFEEKNNQKVPLKYNSKTELYNPFMNSKMRIGTAKNIDFGRSRTISRLILTEFALYPDIMSIMASAGQTVVPDIGVLTVETTAHGFNEYKSFRTEDNGFNHLFYRASDFYSPEFLAQKRKELKHIFPQEYPETEIEAFLTSGDCYFDVESLKYYLNRVARKPIDQGVIYA